MRYGRGYSGVVHVWLIAGMCLSLAGSVALAQAAPASVAAQQAAGATGSTPVFDVATIKPNASGDGHVDIDENLNTLTANNVSMKLLLENAFHIRQELISGLPGWAESAHYDIVAKVVDADPKTMRNLTDEQRRMMLERLLADRFGLKTHIEVKQLPVFDLVIAKGGIKFHELDRSNPNAKQDSVWVHNTEMTAYGVPVEELTATLEGVVQRNVINKTKLTGKYDFHLKWSKGDGSDAGLSDDVVPTLFTALQEQLGLKLQSSKGPVDTLVVDHIQPPSEN